MPGQGIGHALCQGHIGAACRGSTSGTRSARSILVPGAEAGYRFRGVPRVYVYRHRVPHSCYCIGVPLNIAWPEHVQ